MRPSEGDLLVIAGDDTSKSATSCRFVALSAERLARWMASDLSKLDLLVNQIDGLHIGNDLVLVATLGIDADRQTAQTAACFGTPGALAGVGTDNIEKAERLLPPARPAGVRCCCQHPRRVRQMLTVNRLGPLKLRRSLAYTNSIENMMGTLRRVCRDLKRWRNGRDGAALDRLPGWWSKLKASLA
jgi:hypothetical protein